MIVVAGDARYARPIDGGGEDFCGLEVGRNEDPSVEARADGLRSDGVGEIARGGAADGVEAEFPGGGERDGDDAVFERKRGEADGVVFDVKTGEAPILGKTRRGDERGAANRKGWTEIFGEGKQFGVAPDVERAGGERVAAEGLFQRVVVIGYFEGGKAVFAE